MIEQAVDVDVLAEGLISTEVPPRRALEPLLAASSVRHKHLCPRQVLGVRIGLRGLLALRFVDADYRFPFDNSRKWLLTIVETDGCGADGISVATDSDVGRRTLRVRDCGKMAATLVDTRDGRAVRVAPRSGVRQLAQVYAPQERSRWHAYRRAYMIMPDSELLTVSPVSLVQSVGEILSRPHVRTNCDLCGEEIINERELARNGRTLCRHCAGDSYYKVLTA